MTRFFDWNEKRRITRNGMFKRSIGRAVIAIDSDEPEQPIYEFHGATK
jgi:hypothetical protein